MREMIKMATPQLWNVCALVLIPVLSACPNDEPVSTGETGELPSICAECPDEAEVCKCTNLDALEACGEITAQECSALCLANGESVEEYTMIPCTSNAPKGSCSGWNPGASVELTEGVYQVDSSFLEGLTTGTQTAPLWSCDSATIIASTGGFKIANANPGEFLYVLGLRNGDQPLTVNGVSVTSWDGARRAFGE